MDRSNLQNFVNRFSRSTSNEVDTLGKFAYTEHRMRMIEAYADAGLPCEPRLWEQLDAEAQKRWESVAQRVVREFLDLHYTSE